MAKKLLSCQTLNVCHQHPSTWSSTDVSAPLPKWSLHLAVFLVRQASARGLTHVYSLVLAINTEGRRPKICNKQSAGGPRWIRVDRSITANGITALTRASASTGLRRKYRVGAKHRDSCTNRNGVRLRTRWMVRAAAAERPAAGLRSIRKE